jgi:FkbM family methyltransferase
LALLSMGLSRFFSKGRRSRRAAKLSHANALRRLASVGFMPSVIYDIGAYRGDWSRAASEVFPASRFVLFDANADNEPDLAATGHPYVIRALFSGDVAAKPLFLPQTGDATGTSLYVENTRHYAEDNLMVRTVPAMRLDSIVAERGLPPPDLVKLDVQGAEVDVMQGGTEALSRCSALILETSFVTYNKNAPLIADVIAAVDRHGWKCVDICELHRARSGIARQMDLLLVKGPLFEKFCSHACLL